MKRNGIINAELNRVLCSLGHTSSVVVCDAGFPIPPGRTLVDLSLTYNVPEVYQVLKAVAGDYIVERIVVADEMRELSPRLFARIAELFPRQERIALPFADFAASAGSAAAFIRTGDASTPYASVILTMASALDEYSGRYA